jgi:hypothetical protein
VRQHIKLIAQLSVKLTPALIGRKHAVTVGQYIPRIPADQHSSRSLALIQSQQKVSEADDCASAFIATPVDRLGNCVIGAMCKRIAINNEQWSTRVIGCFLRMQDGFGSILAETRPTS